MKGNTQMSVAGDEFHFPELEIVREDELSVSERLQERFNQANKDLSRMDHLMHQEFNDDLQRREDWKDKHRTGLFQQNRGKLSPNPSKNNKGYWEETEKRTSSAISALYSTVVRIEEDHQGKGAKKTLKAVLEAIEPSMGNELNQRMVIAVESAKQELNGMLRKSATPPPKGYIPPALEEFEMIKSRYDANVKQVVR